MSTKHLTAGSVCPPLDRGVLRLYSMKFCPYAERTRLVLHAKNIPHEVVNVNTYMKPEWFIDKNPNSQVPVLEIDGQIVCESLITSDFLDEQFPDQKPLYPTDVYKKARDKMTIDHFNNKVDKAFWKSVINKGADAEAIESFLKELGKTEEDLKQRGNNFFGGNSPGMVDYMIWPIIVRISSHRALGDTDFPASLSLLKAWRARMLEDPTVKSTILPDRAYEEFIMNYRTPTTKFDEIEC